LLGLDGSWHRGRGRDAPPAWIAERWNWGATVWPLHWCDIPDAETLDCGALAALCRALWSSRCEGILPVQLVQRYAAHDTIHWVATWKRDQVETGWIDGDLAYHEIVGWERDGCLELWDSTDTAWLRPTAPGSYGCAVSLRAGSEGGRAMRWESHHLTAGCWTPLDRAPVGAHW
jgi:hypothetical protein